MSNFQNLACCACGVLVACDADLRVVVCEDCEGDREYDAMVEEEYQAGEEDMSSDYEPRFADVDDYEESDDVPMYDDSRWFDEPPEWM